MRFVDYFCGIGGFRLGLERAGHSCVYSCEIEPFPRAVYAARFGKEPESSDITTLEAGEIPDADLWCGGFPCQDLSTAGKRSGIDGERSGLVWKFLSLASERHPDWLLLENVPGLLTTNDGRDFAILLDRLAGMGYLVDADELDAQFFGVPQRRRRIFLLCRRADGLWRKTHSCDVTRLSLAAQSLLDALEGLNPQFSLGSSRSRSPVKSRNHGIGGLNKRIASFSSSPAPYRWLNLLDDLGAPNKRSAQEPRGLGDQQGDLLAESIATEAADESMSSSWRRFWVGLLDEANKFTTSMATSTTTSARICSCARLLTRTLERIGACSDACPSCSEAESFASTALGESMSRVKGAANDLFSGVGVREARDILAAAERIELILARRAGAPGPSPEQILLEREGLRGRAAKGRGARARVARSVTTRAGSVSQRDGDGDLFAVERTLGSGYGQSNDGPLVPCDGVAALRDGEGHAGSRGVPPGSPGAVLRADPGRDGHLLPPHAREVAGPLLSSDGGADDNDAAQGRLVASTVQSHHGRNAPDDQLVASALTASAGHHGRSSPRGDGADNLIAATLTSGGHPNSNAPGRRNEDDVNLVPFDMAQVTSAANRSRCEPGSPAPGAANGESGGEALFPQASGGVRRLMPVECERLQSFPDGWTDIPGASDSKRYKALGNSVAVVVIEWIGRRLPATLLAREQVAERPH